MSSVVPVLSATRAPRPNLNKTSRVKTPARFNKNKKSDNFPISNKNIDSTDLPLRNKYKLELQTLVEVFPNWTETDLYYALEEAEGDLEITIARISDGISCQWGEVKSRKDKLHDAKRAAKQSNKPFSSQATKAFSPRGSNISHKTTKNLQESSSTANTDRDSASANTTERGSTAADQDWLSSANNEQSSSSATTTDRDLDTSTNTVHGWGAAAKNSESTGWSSSSKTRQKDATVSKPQKSTALKSQKPSNSYKNNNTDQVDKNTSSHTPSSSSSVSWAKIAKRAIQTKPQQPKIDTKDLPLLDSSIEKISHKSVVSNEASELLDKDESKEDPEDVKQSGSTSSNPSSELEQLEPEPLIDDNTPLDSSGKESSALEQEAVTPATTLPEDKAADKSVQLTQKIGTPARIMQQKEAVVMPPGSHTIDQLGLKFGNLSTAQSSSQTKSTTSQEAPPPTAEPTESKKNAQETTTISEGSNAEQQSANNTETSASFSSAAHAQNALLAYAANQQQLQNQYQQSGMLAMPQGPLPNDFGSSVLYGVDANRANAMAYYNENFSQANPLSSNSQNKEESSSTTQNIASNPTNNTNTPSNISGTSLGMNSYPQQFQPNSYQGLSGLQMYSPFYYNIGMMQPGNQYHNPGIGSAYNQHFMKQNMFPMYPNNLQNLNMQQAQYQQLSMLQQQLQMSQNLAQNQAQQNSQPPSQPQQNPQQTKQAKQTQINSSNSSQHVGLNSQRTAQNPAVGQYGAYNMNTHSNNQQQPGNIPFDSEASQAQNAQQYGLSNAQIPGFFNSASKASPVAEPVISSIPNKDITNSGSAVSGNLNPNQPAAIIGGTTFYSNPQHPAYPSQVPAGYPGYSQSQQVLSPQQYYGNYGHNQQSSFVQSQPSSGTMSSVYNPKAQYHHSSALHNTNQQPQQPQSQQSQNGSYNPYNQLRSTQGYWAGQN
ncbi:hypothetical protein BB561_006136 [Smittium simulii]|uniref:RNA polymerase II degradation factor 1 n=1 Tax=Smittium simulii TaxID=133385 RepID=A0A2T9Y6B6_9FUNG|nr:hypothetical protein BB561_006136 [Smittium simulii]